MAPDGNSDDLQHRVEELENRVTALERFLDRAPARPPIGEPTESWPSDRVRRLAMKDSKLAAIKLLAEETGLSLKAAKEIVYRL
jgi:ribosomal protein L7/L12